MVIELIDMIHSLNDIIINMMNEKENMISERNVLMKKHQDELALLEVLDCSLASH